MSNLRLTLRTLLAYLDDTLAPADARVMGQKVAENPPARELMERIRKVTRRRGIGTPTAAADRGPSDPNTVAEYLSDALDGDKLTGYESTCLESDVHLAEVAAVHQILTVVLSEPVRVPPTARRRMYQIAKGKESVPDRPPGDIPPVGGVLPREEKAVDGADADEAPLLLGLNRAGSPQRRAGLAAAAVGVAALLAAAVWLAVPAVVPLPADPAPAFALVTIRTPAPVPAPVPPPPKVEEAPPQAPEKPKDPVPMKEPEKPAPPVPEPNKEDPKPPMPDKPKDPPVELAAPPAPPRPEVGPVGRYERSVPLPVLLRWSPDVENWVRLTPEDSVVSSGLKLLCLPGYRATVRFDTGATVELWGNLPDLLPAPLLAASVTPHAPAPGFDADLTLHAGRVYLAARKMGGGKVRVRFADQVWDVAFPDEKGEAAVEVVRALVPGPTPEPPQVLATFAVTAGTAGLAAGFKAMPQLAPGDVVSWDSKGKGLDGPRKTDPMAAGRAPAYFAKFPLPPDANQAKLVLAALDDLSKRLKDASRYRVAFAEMLTGRADRPTPADVANARVGVFAEAATADLAGLVQALSDPDRGYAREAAADALPGVLAADPGLAAALRQTLLDKARLTDEQADATVRMVRGFSDAERKSPAVIDKLVDGLSSPVVCVRELSFATLVTDIDPDSRAVPTLARFNAGGADADREAAVRAWRQRADALKKKFAAPNGK